MSDETTTVAGDEATPVAPIETPVEAPEVETPVEHTEAAA